MHRMRIVDLGWVNIHVLNFVVSGSKFTTFLFNVRGIVVDNTIYCLSIVPSVPETFTVKLKSYPKSCPILDVFALPSFKEAVPLPPKKLYSCNHPT